MKEGSLLHENGKAKRMTHTVMGLHEGVTKPNCQERLNRTVLSPHPSQSKIRGL